MHENISSQEQTEIYQSKPPPLPPPSSPPSPQQHNSQTTIISNLSIFTSKSLFLAQYSIAVIQGFSIYIISALLSLAQLIQFKVHNTISSPTPSSKFSTKNLSPEKCIPAKKVNENRQRQQHESSQLDHHDDDLDDGSLFLKPHVLFQRIWSFLRQSAVQDQEGAKTVLVPEKNSSETADSESTLTRGKSDQPGYSNKIRKALVRTISGNLIPRIKRVTFNDHITVLDEETQKIPTSSSYSSSTLSGKTNVDENNSTNNTSIVAQDDSSNNDLNTNQKSNEPQNEQPPPQDLSKTTTPLDQSASPVQNALATTLFSVLTAHATTSTPTTKTAARSTSSAIDAAAASMLMTVPIALVPSMSILSGNICRETDVNKHINNNNNNSNSPLARSRSAPSKSSAFLQKYRENQNQQPLLQPQQQQQQQQQHKNIVSTAAAACPRVIVTQYDDNDNNIEQENIIMGNSESRHVSGSRNSGRPRSSSTSSAMHSKAPPATTKSSHFSIPDHSPSSRRKSLDLDSINPEHKNFIYRITHPQKYKREIDARKARDSQ